MKNLITLIAFVLTTLSAPVALAENTVPVTVDSDPQGVTFSFTVPNRNFTITGTTPARINDVPVGKAFVHFETINGCTAPKPQSRAMGQDTLLHFFGRYSCSKTEAPAEIIIEKPVVPSKHITARVSPSQLEALPGSTVHFTVATHNNAASIDTPVTVRYTFNPEQMTVVAVPQGGRLIGNNAIEWVLPRLDANATWSATVSMKINANTRGASITSNVTASASGVKTASASTQLGTPELPKTGFGYDTIFVLLTTLGGLAYSVRRTLA